MNGMFIIINACQQLLCDVVITNFIISSRNKQRSNLGICHRSAVCAMGRVIASLVFVMRHSATQPNIATTGAAKQHFRMSMYPSLLYPL